MAGDMAVLVGRNIRLAREMQGRYNQRQLAAEITKRDPQRAAANTSVSEWERGIRRPTDAYMKLLSDVLEQPVDWFFRDHEAEAETPDPFNSDDPLPGFAQRLADLEEAVRQVDEKVDLLSAQLGARVAAVLALLEDRLPPTAESRRRRRA